MGRRASGSFELGIVGNGGLTFVHGLRDEPPLTPTVAVMRRVMCGPTCQQARWEAADTRHASAKCLRRPAPAGGELAK